MAKNTNFWFWGHRMHHPSNIQPPVRKTPWDMAHLTREHSKPPSEHIFWDIRMKFRRNVEPHDLHKPVMSTATSGSPWWNRKVLTKTRSLDLITFLTHFLISDYWNSSPRHNLITPLPIKLYSRLLGTTRTTEAKNFCRRPLAEKVFTGLSCCLNQVMQWPGPMDPENLTAVSQGSEGYGPQKIWTYFANSPQAEFLETKKINLPKWPT